MFFLFVFNDEITESLIKKAQKGDLEAFSTLIERVEPFVYNFALRMMNGNQADAEDMSQEALLRVYKGLKGYKEKASLKTWAVNICKNICLDELRKRQKTQFEEITEKFADFASVHDKAEENERRRALEKAIEALDEKSKALIVLRDINGLSYKEICEVMDMELGTVKSSINRSRKKLKSILLEQNML